MPSPVPLVPPVGSCPKGSEHHTTISPWSRASSQWARPCQWFVFRARRRVVQPHWVASAGNRALLACSRLIPHTCLQMSSPKQEASPASTFCHPARIRMASGSVGDYVSVRPLLRPGRNAGTTFGRGTARAKAGGGISARYRPTYGPTYGAAGARGVSPASHCARLTRTSRSGAWATADGSGGLRGDDGTDRCNRECYRKSEQMKKLF
jgi:hypothetical protein